MSKVKRRSKSASPRRQGHQNQMFSERRKLALGRGKINVCIIKGDLTTEKVDVVVCTANKNLDLSRGRASKVILEAAGVDLINDVQSKYPNGIDYDTIAAVNPGNLPCTKVYFVALPVAGTGKDEKKVLETVLTMCLTEADNHGKASMSIPALGTGFLKYPNEMVVKTTLQCIENYSNNHPSTKLKYVNVVIYYKDEAVFDAFETEARIRSSGGAAGAKPKIRGPSRGAATIGVRSIMKGINVEGPHRVGCLGNTSVRIVPGKLAQFKADVLVNNTKADLKLANGALSESLLEAAGTKLQDECDESYPNGVRQGDVAVTEGYKLDCKIYHGNLPKWDKKNYSAKRILCRFVCNCLEEANADQTVTSIAFPALGTGSLNFPADVSANIMLKCISKFITSHNDSRLSKISIVVYNQGKDWQKVQAAFDDELKAVLKAENEEEDDDDNAEMTLPFKMLEMAAKNSMDRANAPPRGVDHWFKFMCKAQPRTPSYWSHFHDRQTLIDWALDTRVGSQKAHIIDVDTSTFHAIDKLVQDTWVRDHVGQGRDAHGLGNLNYDSIQVTKIARIENYELFTQYYHKRIELFKKGIKKGAFKALENLKGSSAKLMTTARIASSTVLAKDIYSEINEHYVFHGTSVANQIVQQGLDSRLAGAQAMFGQGVYCAESSTKADQYADPRDKRTLNNLNMLLCRVCLGEMYVTSTPYTFARAPCKECSKDKCSCTDNDFYDSVVADGQWNFREFVAYDRQQVYPEYLITYNRKK
ncbi:uncharacterized protein LOC128228688 isoform X2 [Mya arenaria]|uniref:uncharacterized protein LOC128228688 isoform X2 n=1 Tax=Mya arenaria TaxID=6604 RepID=UPI0022E3D652|nr:uncharacterized protein LOC128228688 isoform X2 [Mya arenaria]